MKLNRFLFNWSRAVLPEQNLSNLKIKANQTSQKQYQYILQEFVLLKTKYQVFTKALDKKIEKPKEIFEVKILE
ncbi:MAG: hypothetical protein O3C63_00755 [Cyanobacteria bacterium]|nr:hypothetical protein [Cyanobacteriota bacterium]MDA1020237.1 hypothetical protein [Cyanobacteriota bacterium]